MKRKKDISGLIFSAFLVIAYVICSYFFIGIISGSTGMDGTIKLLLKCLVFVVFGLVLFYATRVGDGKQIKRFSFAALLLIDLPAIYIILAACFTSLPFFFDIASVPETVSIAAVALGYGIPYTFLSGYELDTPESEKKIQKAKNEKTEEEPASELQDDSESNSETETDYNISAPSEATVNTEDETADSESGQSEE